MIGKVQRSDVEYVKSRWGSKPRQQVAGATDCEKLSQAIIAHKLPHNADQVGCDSGSLPSPAPPHWTGRRCQPREGSGPPTGGSPGGPSTSRPQPHPGELHEMHDQG